MIEHPWSEMQKRYGRRFVLFVVVAMAIYIVGSHFVPYEDKTGEASARFLELLAEVDDGEKQKQEDAKAEDQKTEDDSKALSEFIAQCEKVEKLIGFADAEITAFEKAAADAAGNARATRIISEERPTRAELRELRDEVQARLRGLRDRIDDPFTPSSFDVDRIREVEQQAFSIHRRYKADREAIAGE